MFSGICTRCVPRAQVSVRCFGRSGQREPAFHPGGQRLQPPQARHLREHARARPEGQHGLAAREQLGLRRLAERHVDDVHALIEPRPREPLAVRRGIGDPEQHERAIGGHVE